MSACQLVIVGRSLIDDSNKALRWIRRIIKALRKDCMLMKPVRKKKENSLLGKMGPEMIKGLTFVEFLQKRRTKKH